MLIDVLDNALVHRDDLRTTRRPYSADPKGSDIATTLWSINTFTFIDLFAGVGGFHAALGSHHQFSQHQGLGGTCLFACDIDEPARRVYETNWGLEPNSDIIPLTVPTVSEAIPKHDVLCAGFPCQPFSKSGKQRGMEEARGTLFYNICKIVEARKPAVVLLENVRNLAGPRHENEWRTIIRMLRQLGYRVSSQPAVFSPHLLPPERNGSPQVRERVFIAGTYVGSAASRDTNLPPLVTPHPVGDWDPMNWDIESVLDPENPKEYRITARERRIIQVWNDFLKCIPSDEKLPGFPVWADALIHSPIIPDDAPMWKINFLRKNSDLFNRHQAKLTKWLTTNDYLRDLPPSRQKFEWQAQDSKRNLYNCLIHFRPSGIRVKKPTYVPALVAITQTSVVGPRRRRITPREAAAIQGFPKEFEFGNQGDPASYKQMGNAVAVGAVQHVFKTLLTRDAEILARHHPDFFEKIDHLIEPWLLTGEQLALAA